MIKYCDIFWSFFKVGTFTIGGGYAMIPLMQRELVDRHHWISSDEFLDYIALSQAMPGVFAVNMATVVGQRLRGLRGALTAIVGNILMPILFILLLAVFFRAFRDNIYVQRIFMGLRPCVVALIAAPVFTMWKGEWEKRLQDNETTRQRAKESKSKFSILNFQFSIYLIPILSALLIWLFGVNPIIIVLIAALLGYLYSLIANR